MDKYDFEHLKSFGTKSISWFLRASEFPLKETKPSVNPKKLFYKQNRLNFYSEGKN